MLTKNPVIPVQVIWDDVAEAIPCDRAHCVWNNAARRTLKLSKKNTPRMDASGFGHTDLTTGERVKLLQPAWVPASLRVFDELGEKSVEEARAAVFEVLKGRIARFEEVRRVKYHHGRVSEEARKRSNATRKNRANPNH